jgi:hypothetical protein
MRVCAVSDMHGQLPQIPGCPCSGGRPQFAVPEPHPVPVDSSLRPPHPVRALDSGHRPRGARSSSATFRSRRRRQLARRPPGLCVCKRPASVPWTWALLPASCALPTDGAPRRARRGWFCPQRAAWRRRATWLLRHGWSSPSTYAADWATRPSSHEICDSAGHRSPTDTDRTRSPLSKGVGAHRQRHACRSANVGLCSAVDLR